MAIDQLTLQLKNLGLSEYESLVYGTLLSASPSNATFIAKKCNLSRSSVYTTLSALTAKGLVGTTYKNDVKQFIAEGPESLEQLLSKEKEILHKRTEIVESLKESLPFFNRSDIQVPQIIFFEGQEGLKKIYLSMMRDAPKNSTLYLLRDEFVWEPQWQFVFEQEWHDRVKKWKIEKDIHTKLLINPSVVEKEQAVFYKSKKALEFRYLPKKNGVVQFAQYVLGDTIAILSMEKNNLVGIRIVNPHLAENYRKTFNTLWEGSSK